MFTVEPSFIKRSVDTVLLITANLRHKHHKISNKHCPVKKQKANSNLPASAVAQTAVKLCKYIIYGATDISCSFILTFHDS
jgi:hypothetical protein